MRAVVITWPEGIGVVGCIVVVRVVDAGEIVSRCQCLQSRRRLAYLGTEPALFWQDIVMIFELMDRNAEVVCARGVEGGPDCIFVNRFKPVE
jgi:hypothetical protein